MATRRKLLMGMFGVLSLLFVFNQGLSAPELKVTRVDSKKVCMVTNMVFPNEQIPVKVGEKLYYGCCAMCKKTLAEDSSARTATDPVSGTAVDKADAVIAAFKDGKVLYFQNEKNMETYNGRNL
jgi:YHS domain-containing protein